jgi:hypothetical protein
MEMHRGIESSKFDATVTQVVPSPLCVRMCLCVPQTFFRWTNSQLAKRQLSIASLRTGLCDGVMLCNLIELLAKRALPARPNKNGKSQVVRLDNLCIAFNFLEHETGLHLVNIRPSDIETGNIKIILGLVWRLIHRYQIIKGGDKPMPALATATAAASAAASPIPSSKTSSSESSESESSAKADLLRWVNAQVSLYAVGTALDFGCSFQDGKILSALVDSLDENSSKQLHLSGNAMNDVVAAVARAEKDYAIPVLMDPLDIVSRPQQHSLMTYISCFREYVANRAVAQVAPAGPAARGNEAKNDSEPEDSDGHARITKFDGSAQDFILLPIVQRVHLTHLKLLNAKETMAAVSEAIKQSSSMTTVDLSSNEIGDEGAKALAEAIKQSKSMTSVHLSINKIGAEGAKV